jgi:protein involved in polysaccharide export with SLBB domain
MVLIHLGSSLLPRAQVDTGPYRQQTDQVLLQRVYRDSYMLGPGDVVEVVVEGGCTEAMLASGVSPLSVCTVSCDGMISVPGIGRVEADGRTIEQVEAALRSLALEYYPRMGLGLSLARPRSVRATARGLVESPGSYELTAVNKVSELLEVAGGLCVYASRRGTMILESGDSLGVDLTIDPGTMDYVSDPYLRNNSIVVFGICPSPVFVVRSSRVVLADERVVPTVETWDVDAPEDLARFLDRTGGLGGNVDLSRSMLVREGSGRPVWSRDDGLSGKDIFPGDTLLLVLLSDSVSVSGAVSDPGRQPYSPRTTVREYVSLAGGSDEMADLNDTRLVREGRVLVEGEEALSFVPAPGDVVEVPYTWIAKHGDYITAMSMTVGIISILYNILGQD